MQDNFILHEMRRQMRVRVVVISRISLVLLGDAFIFVLWLLVSYGCFRLCVCLKARGLKPDVQNCFLILAHWGTLALAVGYVLCDLVGIAKEIRRRWAK